MRLLTDTVMKRTLLAAVIRGMPVKATLENTCNRVAEVQNKITHKETLKVVKEAINDYTHDKISFEKLAELLEINLYELDAAFRKRGAETRKVTLMAVGEWLDKGIVKDLDGNRIRRQSLYPSEKDIEALKRGEMPEEV